MKVLRLFFVCAILCGAVPGSAAAADFYTGIKGGLGLSGFWDAQAADSAGMTGTVRAGFCGGALVTAQFNEVVACQLEFLYAMKGNISRGTYAAMSVQKQWNMDYLEIPLLAKFSWPGKNARPLVYAGPSFALPLLSTYRLATQRDDPGTPGGLTSWDSTYTIKNTASAFDLGLAIGCGMDFVIETGIIIFDLRYTPGFISWDRQAGQDKKNYCIAFMIGYAYKF
jgi:hypothetical protein